MKENILVTSALPYVNNVPHMGNLIGAVLSADVFARFKKSQGNNVLYVCGTDEHGTTTEAAAKKEGLTPKELCDKYYKVHKDVYEWFNIKFDIFGRTSEENHVKITQDIFKRLQKNGYIQEKEVEQLYDEKEKTFLADRFVNGTCPFCDFHDARGDQCDSCGKLLDPTQLKEPKSALSGTKPVRKKSTHLYLDLEKLQPELEPWVNEQSQKGKWTQNAISTTEAWLKKGLEPRAITRDLSWGVPVPGMKNKVFYVWFDAPIGYISITEQLLKEKWTDWWQHPKEIKLFQFMAKDNIPFHTILFPASLIGTKDEWTLLHHINVTEYLQHEDGKFSKSRGTGLFGDQAMKLGIPSDVFRYYLLVNRPEKADSLFAWNDLQEKLNNELLKNVGNLVNRTLVFIEKYLGGKVPGGVLDDVSENFVKWIAEESIMVTADLEYAKEKDALKRIMAISQRGNQYFQEQEPWKTREENPGACQRALFVLANLVKDLAIMIEPFMPSTSRRIFKHLKLKPQTWTELGNLSLAGHEIGKPKPLFKKLEDKDLAKIKEQLAPKKEEPLKELQLRAGKLVKVEKHPEADKLYVETVSFGDEERTIVSGLVDHYKAEELEGKTAIFVTNLKPAKLRGVESNGMILAADDKKQVEVVLTEAEPGAYIIGSNDTEQITIDEFAKHKLTVKKHSVLVDGAPLEPDGKPIVTQIISDGKVR